MKNSEVNEMKLKNGDYCQKKIAGCFCKVGWPRERQCSNCMEENDKRTSCCVCPPKYSVFKN